MAVGLVVDYMVHIVHYYLKQVRNDDEAIVDGGGGEWGG